MSNYLLDLLDTKNVFSYTFHYIKLSIFVNSLNIGKSTFAITLIHSDFPNTCATTE